MAKITGTVVDINSDNKYNISIIEFSNVIINKIPCKKNAIIINDLMSKSYNNIKNGNKFEIKSNFKELENYILIYNIIKFKCIHNILDLSDNSKNPLLISRYYNDKLNKKKTTIFDIMTYDNESNKEKE